MKTKIEKAQMKLRAALEELIKLNKVREEDLCFVLNDGETYSGHYGCKIVALKKAYYSSADELIKYGEDADPKIIKKYGLPIELIRF